MRPAAKRPRRSSALAAGRGCVDARRRSDAPPPPRKAVADARRPAARAGNTSAVPLERGGSRRSPPLTWTGGSGAGLSQRGAGTAPARVPQTRPPGWPQPDRRARCRPARAGACVMRRRATIITVMMTVIPPAAARRHSSPVGSLCGGAAASRPRPKRRQDRRGSRANRGNDTTDTPGRGGIPAGSGRRGASEKSGPAGHPAWPRTVCLRGGIGTAAPGTKRA